MFLAVAAGRLKVYPAELVASLDSATQERVVRALGLYEPEPGRDVLEQLTAASGPRIARGEVGVLIAAIQLAAARDQETEQPSVADDNRGAAHPVPTGSEDT